MSLDYGRFKFGSVEYPLPDDPFVDALLRLDPSLHACLAYFRAMLVKHLGPYFDKLVATPRVNLADLVGKVVAESVGYDPAPTLTSTERKFPMLALYRTSAEFKDHTVTWHKADGSWSLLYLLPPMVASQLASMQHVLKAVQDILVDRTIQGYDPDYLSGALVFELAGITKIRFVSAQWGSVGAVNDGNIRFPAIEMKLDVTEREGESPGLDDFSGIDATLDVSNGTLIDNTTVVEVSWENS